MNGTAEVCLTLTDGPICGLGDAGIEVSYPLGDSIIAAESFPPGAGASGANYVLRLKIEVSHASEVRHAEDGLTKALQLLAAAWPFSGGSYLIIETREVVCSPRFENNANDLEREMLARSGLTRVVSEVRMPLGWSAPYSQAPLCVAARIAQSMHSDFPTRRLLLYHQGAVIERGHSSWFISLYKVRDFLCKLYNGEKATKEALNITKGWSYFGNLLNHNDLRHAEISGNVPSSISNSEIDKLYRLAHCWVASYLRNEKSLPALG
jgi:hypothetical protein